MIDVDKAVVAKFKVSGETYEVLVDCDNAVALKSGKVIDMDDILASKSIFSDARKGLLAQESKFKSVFGTDDILEAAKMIIIKGEIQLTAEYRKKIVENKHKRIVDYICRNGVDPKTGYPHPRNRIELALLEAKIHIDEYDSVLDQVHIIIKKIRTILPINFEKKKIAVKIPSAYAEKGFQAVQGFGEIKEQDWQTDGSWLCIIEIPAGIQNDLFDKLNNMTHGDVETKILS